jgi:AcrR family transcriptional regulator
VTHQTIPPGPEAETIDRILESARACFLRKGVRKTRISDIAEGAGMVRQTVYDWVASRDELVDLAMARRIRELGAIIQGRANDPRQGLADQLVEVLADMIELAADDVEFENLAQAMPEAHAFAFIAGPSELTDVVGEILEPFLERARGEGVLRDGMGDRALAEWVQIVLAPLRGRRDLDPQALRQRLRYFLLPALLQE